MKSLVITPELRIQLELLALMEPDFVSDLVLALIETLNGIHLDPEEMPDPVRKCYIYWMNGNLASIIKVE